MFPIYHPPPPPPLLTYLLTYLLSLQATGTGTDEYDLSPIPTPD